jgi:penicillin-binding protein 1C
VLETQAGSRVFSREVAYQIFDVLADPDARRPMFGSSAPMELPYPVALKTGTTRGYTDNLAFGTTREFTVGAWAGNFDGKPMQGVMAMQGAAPLVRAAFVALAALYGDPSAPERPGTLFNRDVCAVSGQIAGPHCPTRKRDWFTAQSARELERHGPCTFHADGDAEHPIAFPVELGNWARAHQLDDLTRARAAITSNRIDEAPDPAPSTARKPGLVIVYPPSGSRFVLDPDRPAKSQLPPLQTLPTNSDVSFTIDGIAARDFRPTPGRHVVRAQLGELFDESEIAFE